MGESKLFLLSWPSVLELLMELLPGCGRMQENPGLSETGIAAVKPKGIQTR